MRLRYLALIVWFLLRTFAIAGMSTKTDADGQFMSCTAGTGLITGAMPNGTSDPGCLVDNASASFVATRQDGYAALVINFQKTGAGSLSAQIERSYDGGTTWVGVLQGTFDTTVDTTTCARGSSVICKSVTIFNPRGLYSVDVLTRSANTATFKAGWENVGRKSAQ